MSGYKLPGFIALPIALAEIVFPLWLLVKGINRQAWARRALAAS